MPLYDLDRGGSQIVPSDIFQKYVSPVGSRLDKRTLEKMIRTVDAELYKLKPSKKSQLVWTKCAALCGYQSNAPVQAQNHLWRAAEQATTFDPDGCNKFVGSLIMWRISLLGDIWLSTKTKDEDGIHPYRTYWINDSFIPPGQGPTLQDLVNKFKKH